MARRPTSRASRGAVAAAATAVPESSAPSAHTPVGTNDDPTALVDYSVGGTLNIYPSLAASATCFGAFQGSLGVDGMTDQFYFLGASSQFDGGDQFASRESRDVVPILIRESPKLA